MTPAREATLTRWREVLIAAGIKPEEAAQIIADLKETERERIAA